jgi:hypothetical protein
VKAVLIPVGRYPGGEKAQEGYVLSFGLNSRKVVADSCAVLDPEVEGCAAGPTQSLLRFGSISALVGTRCFPTARGERRRRWRTTAQEEQSPGGRTP